MNKAILYFISFAVIGIVLVLLSRCKKESKTIIQRDTVEVIKDRIVQNEDSVAMLKKEVALLKEENKSLRTKKYVYKTDFDSTATKSQVLNELIKCDSAVKGQELIVANQDSIIGKQDQVISKQDTIIADQKEVISILETDNMQQRKEVKRQKRIALITKIIGGVAIVVSMLL
jgi:hypothetical protein